MISSGKEPLIPKHGGYRKLKSFQIAQLIYDITVRFCDLYIEHASRTRDQMVQAARSGVQNLAEASMASATSKKTELKLTNVARASLEELRLDYEDFLRQRGLELFDAEHPALKRFKTKRCKTLDEVRAWVAEELKSTQTNTDLRGLTQSKRIKQSSVNVREPVRVSPCPSFTQSAFVANAALSLLNLCCYFLDRQLMAQAAAFEKEGGFTERLYRVRSAAKKGK